LNRDISITQTLLHLGRMQFDIQRAAKVRALAAADVSIVVDEFRPLRIKPIDYNGLGMRSTFQRSIVEPIQEIP